MTSVLNLFESRCLAGPEALAVSFAGRRVTYAQLDAQANRIGSLLQAAGVARETLVAVYLERSADLIAGLLGVWKAGGAYLPIDPTNPRQRVESILEDAGVTVLLTERKLASSLPATGAKLVCVEENLASADSIGLDRARLFVPAQPSPDQLAYVVYTSGSTGRPKGAEITHGGLHNVIESIGKDVALKPTDVVLASATIAFDISNEEIFLPLAAGASVHLLEPEFTGDGGKLVEIMDRSNLSLAFGTPTSWRLLIEAGWKGDRDLQIIVGGEVLPLSLARTLARMSRAVWNHYGPSEAAICATRERIEPDARQVSLGTAIDNVSIYVLDQELRPAPAGETGEIYIGGAGVGRGYRNRPELTERAFVEDPFSALPGKRMYKTGDLGRLLPDGRLDFLGRADNQVKLRGFRIELEEIEGAIRNFRGVHAAVAQVVEYGADDQRLVAYYLADAQVSAGALREELRRRVPYYMLPSELIPLQTLPMTSNGKVDRQALDALRIAFQAGPPQESAVPAADELEATLQGLWQRLLKVRTVGPNDDFFDMGGHSLLATRMFTEVEKLTGIRVPLSVLIRNPTVAELSAYLRTRSETSWPGLVAIREHGSRPPLFLVHGLGSNLLLFLGLTEELGGDQPVYGVQLAAPATAKPEDLTLEAIAARNVEEICAVDPVGPYYLAGHSLGGLLAFEIAAQLRRRGKEIGLLALLDCALHQSGSGDGPTPGEALSLEDVWLRWRKKFQRLWEGGFVNTTRRKVLYERLMFSIWLLRRTHTEGSYRPGIFGTDPYIALFSERYEPQPIDAEGVLFVAEEQGAAEAAGLGWARLLEGRLSVQRVPGSHRTIFSSPHVSVLARELARRLASSVGPGPDRPAARGRSEIRRPILPAELGYGRG